MKTPSEETHSKLLQGPRDQCTSRKNRLGCMDDTRRRPEIYDSMLPDAKCITNHTI
jgi:hypothetical protein